MQGKLFMCRCSSSTALTERDFKYFFRMGSTDKTESREFVEFMKWANETMGTDLQTVGLIYETTEFGKHAADEGKAAAKEAGFEVVADVPFNPGATSMDSEVQTLKAKNPDVHLPIGTWACCLFVDRHFSRKMVLTIVGRCPRDAGTPSFLCMNLRNTMKMSPHDKRGVLYSVNSK